MIFIKSAEIFEKILKFKKTDRFQFNLNDMYKIKDSNICNIVGLEPDRELHFINSAYSRYDSASIYYFKDNENKIFEIWLSDEETIEELFKIFEIVESRK